MKISRVTEDFIKFADIASGAIKSNAQGYNWATRFLREVNSGAWPSRLRES
jgi:hypothetical protein